MIAGLRFLDHLATHHNVERTRHAAERHFLLRFLDAQTLIVDKSATVGVKLKTSSIRALTA